MADYNSNKPINPVFVIAVALGMVMMMASAFWWGKRPEAAVLYGWVRDAMFPFVNQYVPYDRSFEYDVLTTGFQPSFYSIYINSAFYGAFWFLMTLVVMYFAVSRLSDSGIKKHVSISSSKGRTFEEIMEKYATNQPHVQFFIDYNVLQLPTTFGTARQQYTALETLVFADAIGSVIIDTKDGQQPVLEIDAQKMRQWYIQRFGPENPFVALFPEGKIDHVSDVEEAVRELRWDTVLIIYPALRRLLAFYVENDKGFKIERKEVDAFCENIWAELNGFKREFGSGIELGYANALDRAEREARYARLNTKAKKEPEEFVPFTDTAAKTQIENIYEAGKAAREAQLSDVAEEAQTTTAKGRKKKKGRPQTLQFFGEVLEARGNELECVQEARKGLVTVLTRHLGGETEDYPIRYGKDGRVEYSHKVEDHEQAAFNQQTQAKLNSAMVEISKILLRHRYQFGLVGSSLEKARESGIMPPNLFRYLRFSRVSESLWWFVHNLGMPSSVPENAGLYEHYLAECLTGMPLSRPFVNASIDGLKNEAEKYLTEKTVDELRACLGKERFRDIFYERQEESMKAVRALRDGAGKGSLRDLAGILDEAHGATEEEISVGERETMRRLKGQASKPKKPDAVVHEEDVPEQVYKRNRATIDARPDPQELARRAEEEHAIPAMSALLTRIIPNQAAIDVSAAKQHDAEQKDETAQQAPIEDEADDTALKADEGSETKSDDPSTPKGPPIADHQPDSEDV